MPRKDGLKFFQKTYFLEILGIFLASLLPLFWFKKDLIITYFDFDFPFPPFYGYERYFYLWDRLSAIGTPFSKITAEIPFRALVQSFSHIGIPLIFIEKIYFVFLFFSSGISMYFLVATVLHKDKIRPAALVASLFYMFNPLIMNVYLHSFVLPAFHVYAFLPMILALFIKGLNEKRLIYSLCIGFVSIFISVSFNNASWPSVTFIVLFLYFIFYNIKNNKNYNEITFSVKFLFITMFIFFVLNAYWLLPQLYFLKDEFFKTTLIKTIIGHSAADVLKITSQRSNIMNVVRLEGLYNLYMQGNPYFVYSYGALYKEKLFIFISIMIPVICIFSLIYNKKDENFKFFGILLIFAIFAMKGAQWPFGNLVIWLFRKIPILGIYRDIYSKFAVVLALSYAFLIGTGITLIHNKLKKNFGSLFSSFVVNVVTFLLVVIFPLPMWRADVVPKKHETYPGGFVRVPEYYGYADKWLLSQKEYFRIFSLPFNRLFYSVYNWQEGYFGTDPSLWLFNKPTISRITDASYYLPLYIAEALLDSKNFLLGKALGYLNVKYILLHEDFHWKSLQTNMPKMWWVLPEKNSNITSDFFENLIRKQRNFQLKETFGKLKFYKNDAVVDYIYIPDKIIAVNLNKEIYKNFIDIVKFADFTNKTAIFFYDSSVTNQLILKECDVIYLYPKNILVDGKIKNLYFEVPFVGYYEIYLGPADTKGSVTIRNIKKKKNIDNISISSYDWVYVGKEKFDQKNIILQLKSEFAPDHEIVLRYSKPYKQKSLPNIKTYIIENPTHFIVRIENAIFPYFLIFGEQHHPEWRASINNNILQRHLIANSFANAWYVDKKGDYDIVMRFLPQKILYAGEIISLVSFLFFSLKLIDYYRRLRLKREAHS